MLHMLYIQNEGLTLISFRFKVDKEVKKHPLPFFLSKVGYKKIEIFFPELLTCSLPWLPSWRWNTEEGTISQGPSTNSILPIADAPQKPRKSNPPASLVLSNYKQKLYFSDQWWLRIDTPWMVWIQKQHVPRLHWHATPCLRVTFKDPACLPTHGILSSQLPTPPTHLLYIRDSWLKCMFSCYMPIYICQIGHFAVFNWASVKFLKLNISIS